MPNMPSPFKPFLEENPNSEENLKQLVHQRKHVYESVKMMQEKLKQLDGRIREIKKQTQNGSATLSK
jgi:phage shock protein A